MEEEIFNSGIAQKLLQKMIKELAILGFVSLTATMLLQFVHLPHIQHLLFEYAHVLLFITAVMYAKEIYIISGTVERIAEEFEQLDFTPEEEVERMKALLEADREAWENYYTWH